MSATPPSLAPSSKTQAGSATGAVLLAFAVGALCLFLAGFAGANVLHDAAHDSRHSFAFPCH